MDRVSLLLVAVLATVLPVAGGVAVADPPGAGGAGSGIAGAASTVTSARRPAGAPVRARAGAEATARALAVLHDWDRRRAAAWAAGDPAALADLYVPGSAAGAVDQRMLRRWSRRGVRVLGLRVQVLAARVVRAGPGRLVLLVTDRLVSGRAVGPRVDVPLPRDAATIHRVALRRLAGRWRVVRVRPVSPPGG